ncbi:unnamed protein product [Colias eurytheme]|nr:unnamed protein product [Colias eurytheme]
MILEISSVCLNQIQHDNDIPTVNLDDTSSAKTDSPPDSNRDSLNSLLHKTKDKNENCIDDCDLGKQCSMICTDNSNDSKARNAFCCSLPPYEWWSDPPDQVRMRVYVFNITNHDRFLAGLDEKINVKEIGPITYLEKLLHSKIRFNENGTMTYEARRFLIYLPDENTINMNTTIIVPNLALLLSGTPFRAVARMQCNMKVSNLSDFNMKPYDRFSNLVIPVGWIEYSQEGLPPIIKNTIYFMVVILPPLSTVFICTTLLVGFCLIIKQIYRAKRDLFIRKIDRLTNNKVLSFETETFIKVPS